MAKYVLEIWDRKCSINGVNADVMLGRFDIPKDGEIYIIRDMDSHKYDSKGDVIRFQPHAPGLPGAVPMTLGDAVGYGNDELDEMNKN
jgi:hypothetical protein